MRKLRFAVVLPILQVVVTTVLLVWTNRALSVVYPNPWRFPRREAYIATCVIMVNTILHGINAPALLLKGFARALPTQGLSIWGIGVGDVFYLAGIAVLWYLVGRTLDRRTFPKEPSNFRMTTGRAWFNLLLATWGVLLLVVSFFSLHDLTQATGVNIHTFYLNWNVWAIALAVVWSLILFIFPGLKLARWIRGKHVSTGQWSGITRCWEAVGEVSSFAFWTFKRTFWRFTRDWLITGAT